MSGAVEERTNPKTVFTNELPEVKAQITERLKTFRKEVEQDVCERGWEVEVPVVFVLDDLCNALGLSEPQREQVLGPGGVAFAQEVSATRVWTVESTNGRMMAARSSSLTGH